MQLRYNVFCRFRAKSSRIATGGSSPAADFETTEWLRRDAEVLVAAERDLAASTARVGIAVADYFPRISLVGNFTASATSISGFGGSNGIGYGVGPTLSWNGFDRSLVGSRVDIVEAETNAALARYEQRVMATLEESQTAFAAYGRERVRLASLNQSVEMSLESADLARLRYDEGASEFLNVLDAEARRLEAEAARLECEQTAALSLINIYQALGAGWRHEEA
ncbi:MAG: TolC family protein [Pseudomonadota bacterium]